MTATSGAAKCQRDEEEVVERGRRELEAGEVDRGDGKRSHRTADHGSLGRVREVVSPR